MTLVYEVVQTADDLEAAIVREVRQHLDIEDLSFDHAFGTHRAYGAAYEGPSPLHYLVLRPEGLPGGFHKSFTLGGCDGEHRGPCKRACVEVEAELYFTLTEEAHELGSLVTVEIEQD